MHTDCTFQSKEFFVVTFISYTIISILSFHLDIKNSHTKVAKVAQTRTHTHTHPVHQFSHPHEHPKQIQQIRKYKFQTNAFCSISFFFYLRVNVCRIVRIVRVHVQVFAIEHNVRMPNAIISLSNHMRPFYSNVFFFSAVEWTGNVAMQQ